MIALPFRIAAKQPVSLPVRTPLAVAKGLDRRRQLITRPRLIFLAAFAAWVLQRLVLP